MNNKEQIKKLEAMKAKVSNEQLKRDIQKKIDILKNNKTVTK